MIIARSLPALLQGATQWRQFPFPDLLAGAAIVGAAIIGNDTGIDGINGFVESLSGESGSWLMVLAGAYIVSHRLTIGELLF